MDYTTLRSRLRLFDEPVLAERLTSRNLLKTMSMPSVITWTWCGNKRAHANAQDHAQLSDCYFFFSICFFTSLYAYSVV